MKYEERQLMEKKEEREPRKKLYAPPRLTNHGDAREITRNIGGAGDDGQSGSQEFDTPTD